MLGKNLRQRSTLAGCIGYLVTLIYNDDIPSCMLYIASKTLTIFQCIYRYDSLIIIVERILVERYNGFDTVHPCRIKTHQRYVETIPQFFLELLENALQSNHKNTLATTSANHLRKKDSHFHGFTKTYGISYQHSRTRHRKSLDSWHQLIIMNIKSALLSYRDMR